MEGTRNTKRDSEGSKHQAGTLLPASSGKVLASPHSEPRGQHDAGALWARKGGNFKLEEGASGGGWGVGGGVERKRLVGLL